MKRIIIFFFCIFVSMNFMGQSIVAGLHGTGDYYYDITPDTLIYGTYPCFPRQFDTDMNGDGIVDFIIRGEICSGLGGGSRAVRIYAKNNNQISFGYIDSCFGFTSPPTPPFPPPSYLFSRSMAHNYLGNEVIDSSSTWFADSVLNLSYDSFIMGQYNCNDLAFADSVPMYLGVRVFLAGDTLYGWIKVSGLSSTSVILEEYASNLGHTSTMDQANSNVLLIYPNPVSNELHLNLPNKDAVHIKVYDSSLRLQLEKEIKQQGDILIDTRLFSAGLYYISVQTNSTLLTNKFIITR